MPQMIMYKRNRVIETKMGHIIAFVADKPTHVPTLVVRECISAGAVAVDESNSELTATSEELKELTASTETREEKIKFAVMEVLEKNSPMDFTASGMPKATVISTMVKFPVQGSEISAVIKAQRENV